MASPPDLVGYDVSMYSMAANGTDGYPNLGTLYNLLGVWQEVTFDFDLTRSDRTPSSQLLKNKRLTGLDWTCNMTNMVASGGGFLTYLLFNGNFNVKLVWQEESNGGIITAYGGISKGSLKAMRESRDETITIENIGPVGTSGSSIFYLPNTVANPGQSANTLGSSTQSIQAYSLRSVPIAPGYAYDTGGLHA